MQKIFSRRALVDALKAYLRRQERSCGWVVLRLG
jgi:hypothetical protein